MFLGMPGDQMHEKVRNCNKNVGWFTESISKAYTNQMAQPDRTVEQLTGDLYDVFFRTVNAGQACWDWLNHIIWKINEFKTLMSHFVNSEGQLNLANFYEAGLYLGYAISRMIA